MLLQLLKARLISGVSLFVFEIHKKMSLPGIGPRTRITTSTVFSSQRSTVKQNHTSSSFSRSIGTFSTPYISALPNQLTETWVFQHTGVNCKVMENPLEVEAEVHKVALMTWHNFGRTAEKEISLSSRGFQIHLRFLSQNQPVQLKPRNSQCN